MRLKLLLRYPVDIRRARRLLEHRNESIPQPLSQHLVLDLRTSQLTFDCGRHFQSIAYYADRAGYATLLRCSNLILSGIARKTFGREMLGQAYVRRIAPSQPIPNGSLVLGDYAPDRSERAEMQRCGLTYLQMLIGRNVDRSVPVMPYPMHPATLRYLVDADLASLRRRTNHRQAILFAGCQKARYGDSWMRREFGILSRLEVLDTLRQQYANRIQESLQQSGPTRPIVLMDSRSHPIPASQWLSTLGAARFFLCCPGGRQPLCHNLVEAMSVGTIPIIEYGDRITPELVDGETAICFRGREGLLDAVRRIDGMTAEQLTELSQRVAQFYDRHLCVTRFLRGLREGEIDASTGRLCMPFHERNLYPASECRAA
jgi:hypothetical protein